MKKNKAIGVSLIQEEPGADEASGGRNKKKRNEQLYGLILIRKLYEKFTTTTVYCGNTTMTDTLIRLQE